MKCEFCTSDFVRKETYRAHIISHHKRSLTEQEFDDVLERIKKFQPPSLDINAFTLEKQKNKADNKNFEEVDYTVQDEDEEEGEIMMEVVEEEGEEDCEEMVMNADHEYFEETELYNEDEEDDEQ